MVMIEAMACGTPVVALNRGAVGEVIDEGVTGVICDTPEELAAAIERTQTLDPIACRRHVEDKFKAEQLGFQTRWTSWTSRDILGRLGTFEGQVRGHLADICLKESCLPMVGALCMTGPTSLAVTGPRHNLAAPDFSPACTVVDGERDAMLDHRRRRLDTWRVPCFGRPPG